MSLFLVYDADRYEYILQPGGYVLMAVILVALIIAAGAVVGRQKKASVMDTKTLVFCSMAIALATVTSFIRLASLPFGGSITLFSMLFISIIGYFYGLKTGLITGVAYGVLQLITGPYIYAPLQVLLDYPLAFGALGLSGLFSNKKHGLQLGYAVAVLGRYICHVISGYVFFAEYAPEGMNPFVYTVVYNSTYIVPELIATLIVISIPAVSQAIERVRRTAV